MEIFSKDVNFLGKTWALLLELSLYLLVRTGLQLKIIHMPEKQAYSGLAYFGTLPRSFPLLSVTLRGTQSVPQSIKPSLIHSATSLALFFLLAPRSLCSITVTSLLTLQTLSLVSSQSWAFASFIQ